VPIILEIYCPPNDEACGNGEVYEPPTTVIETEDGTTFFIPTATLPKDLEIDDLTTEQ